MQREEGCWFSPRRPLGPLLSPQDHAAPRGHDLGQAWAPEPPALGSRKPASQRPTHDCPPGRAALAAEGMPAALGDPGAGSRRHSASEAASTGEAAPPGAPRRSLAQ